MLIKGKKICGILQEIINKQNQKFLIVKGENGLNDIENFINEQGSYSENIIFVKITKKYVFSI